MPTQKIITFITFESPWFKAGGLAAVMQRLPGATAIAVGQATVVVTPFHESTNPRNKISTLSMQYLGDTTVQYSDTPVTISIFNYIHQCSWYFLRISNQDRIQPQFFKATRHPFDLDKNTLLRDSLFFGAAVVQALPIIANHMHKQANSVEWHLLAQDWEAATALLAFASQKQLTGKLHLTLHNSYDAFATDKEFSSVGINPTHCHGDTIIHRTCGIVEQPILTVSEQFALDLTQDLLQSEVMAPHLQNALLAAEVVGIDNGPFKSLEVDRCQLYQATSGNHQALRQWKIHNRNMALSMLQKQHEFNIPLWGDINTFQDDINSPWIIMAGRDDPRQKGFDVAAVAVADYLSINGHNHDCAKFIFFPSPGDEEILGLRFLEELSTRFCNHVLVIPGLWTEGFEIILKSASYGLMPSLYEPFGMANEFYLSGCVGIGRATGGNLQQIVPLRSAAAFGRSVQIRANRYHSLSALPTGILYRERDYIISALSDWQAINAATYNKHGASPSRIEQRLSLTVFQEMVKELRIAIEDGVRIYVENQDLYYQMLGNGIEHILHNFSWHRASQEYARRVR
ncbi:hypothetical protein TI04_03030 [Achromatium sp. WMS2]|nr:hypothetical protein TI04_03030 [Achromatium sp. WMS2]